MALLFVSLGSARQFCSTVRRQTSILMDVHPDLREKAKFRNSTFLGPVRMDNLLQAHSYSLFVELPFNE